MELTVGDLYRFPEFSGMKLIAGESGLGRPITYCGILDYEFDRIFNEKYYNYNYRVGNFLTLTSFQYAKDNEFLILDAVKRLEAAGVDAALINFHTLKPFDKELALAWALRTGRVYTVEEHSVIGGLGDAVADAICGKGAFTFRKIGINDEFGQSGKPADLLREYGLTGEQIAQNILAD